MAIPNEYLNFASQAAEKYGVSPELVHYVLNRESRGNPTAVSSAGALGLMQLMPATGAQLGLRGQDFFDPYRNIDAGVRYLSQLGKQFNNDPTAMMIGYNAGPGVAQRYVRGQLHADQLPGETRAYVAGYGAPAQTQSAAPSFSFDPTHAGMMGAPAPTIAPSGLFPHPSLYNGAGSPSSVGSTNDTAFNPFSADQSDFGGQLHTASFRNPFFSERIGTYNPDLRNA